MVFEQLPEMDDDGMIEHLTRVKGIGVWTAQMFLMFALKVPDVLPVADLGIRTAAKRAYQLAELPKAAELEPGPMEAVQLDRLLVPLAEP